MKHIGLIGSGWLAQGMARAWKDNNQITLTTRKPEKQQALIAEGFNCVLYDLGDTLPFLANMDCLIIAITSKDLPTHQQLLTQLKLSPDLPILYTSSTSVYPNDGRSHSEDSPYLLKDHPLMTIEKCLQEHPLTTVIRCGGLIGPGRHPGRFFRNKTIPSPKAPVNLLPLIDAVGIFWHAITHHLVATTINACHNEHPNKGDYYPKMADAISLPAPVCQTSTDNPGKIVDTSRLIKELGYRLQGDIWHIEE